MTTIIDEARDPPTLAELADALAEVVDELMEYRARRRERPSPASVLVTVRSICETSHVVRHERCWAEHPIERALKHGMKEIGQIIFDRLGTLNALRDVVEDVCERDPRRAGARLSMLDSALNGVGDEKSFWVS